ncbi:MAG: M56 family metallopeptidase, partial [Chthoniobacterales bacterium]
MNDLLIKFVMFRSWYPQIAGFLFCAIKSSAIIFLGAAVALFLRNHSAAARCWIWRGILIALLALFVFDFGPFALWAYRAKVSVAVKAEDRVAYNREAEYLEIIHSWEGMEAIKEQKREQSYLSNNPLPPWDWSSLIITLKDIQRSPWKEINATLHWIIWSVSTLLILLWITRLFIGARLLARSGSFANQDWQLLAAHVAEELKIHKIPLVRIIESVSSPLLSGFRIPVICLSPYALLWSREKLRVVFLHELAHWKRWDYGWQQIGK